MRVPGAGIEIDPTTGKPYMPIMGQSHYRLTSAHINDVDEMVILWSEPTIGQWAFRRPYPYTRKDTQFYFDTILPRAQEALQEIHRHVNVDDNAAPRAVGAFPLAALRYHRPPSTPLTRETIDLGLRSGQLVGVVSAFPWEAGGIGYEQMIALPPAEQIWEVAYDLLPTLQGKGLGRGVMQCVVDWAEWVGIGKLIATVEEKNLASTGLVKKLGFSEEKRFSQPWPEDKGGGERVLVRWAKVIRPETSRDQI